MKQFISLFLCLTLIVSCSDDDNKSKITCSVEKPIENLDWLKSEIDLLINKGEKYDYIVQAEYNAQIIFIFANCNPSINSVYPVKNCAGKNIGIIGEEQDNISFDILENGTIIWKPQNFECDLEYTN